MKQPLLKLIKQNQIIWKFRANCPIKHYYYKKNISSYVKYYKCRNTKFVPLCTLQGKYKHTYKAYHFNRHLIRNNLIKDNFSSATTPSW